MEQTGIFKYIWRMVAIGLLLMTLAGVYSFIRSEFERHHRHNMNRTEPLSTLAADPQKVEQWVLRVKPYMPLNSDYTVLSLFSKYNKVKEVDRNSYATTSNVERYYHIDRAKNVLFVNIKENSSSWLFPNNNQLILEYGSNAYMIEHETSYHVPNGTMKEEIKSTFIYYKLINKDSNGDKIITQADHESFAISDMTGKNYKVLFEDIENIISIKMIDKNSMNIIYQKSGATHSLKLDTNTFEVLSDVLLPKVGE